MGSGPFLGGNGKTVKKHKSGRGGSGEREAENRALQEMGFCRHLDWETFLSEVERRPADGNREEDWKQRDLDAGTREGNRHAGSAGFSIIFVRGCCTWLSAFVRRGVRPAGSHGSEYVAGSVPAAVGSLGMGHVAGRGWRRGQPRL